jgi:hypothetical protein
MHHYPEGKWIAHLAEETILERISQKTRDEDQLFWGLSLSLLAGFSPFKLRTIKDTWRKGVCIDPWRVYEYFSLVPNACIPSVSTLLHINHSAPRILRSPVDLFYVNIYGSVLLCEAELEVLEHLKWCYMLTWRTCLEIILCKITTLCNAITSSYNCDQSTCQLSSLSLCTTAVGMAWPLIESPGTKRKGITCLKDVLYDENTLKI